MARFVETGVSSSMGKHNWAAIGHIGDGNEYMVFICDDCGCRATPPDGQQPDDTKYPPCKTPHKKAVKKLPDTAWDRIRGKEIL